MNKFLKRLIIAVLCIGLLFSGIEILDNNKLNAAETFDFTLSAHTDGYGSVTLDWSGYDYQDKNFKVYKSNDGGLTYETIGIDYTLVDEVKCLQIYPISNASNQLKNWMEKNGYGKGIIKIDSVYIDTFNANPNAYLKDGNGNYKYDVIFFGTWNANNSKDLSSASKQAVEKYIKSGRGCIMGHDTISYNPYGSGWWLHYNFKELAPYFGLTTHNLYNDTISPIQNWNISDNIKITHKGLFTNYPWYIGEIGTVLTIPATHNVGQRINKATKWLEFCNIPAGAATAQSIDNYYLATYNNCASIMTGHSNGQATADEQKILANLIFYCNQLLFDTWNSKYSSAQDFASPNAPTANVSGSNFIWSATDNGSTYHYYVESFDKNNTTESGLLGRSSVKQLTVTTGVKKYRYILDNSASTTVTLSNGIETTETSILANRNYDYLHVAAIDGAGNLGATTTVAIPQTANYKINHYKMDINGNYVLENTETYSGIIGTNAENHIKSYEGFTSPSGQTATIKADGSTVINYYYERNKYDVEYIDVVNNVSGTELGRTVQKVYYDSLIYGGDIGNSTADNAYYNGYYYVEDTFAKVTTSGATVYRIFNRRTIDISGTVLWRDNSNKHDTRPENTTITLYRDGEAIDTYTGLVSENSNTYTFPDLPKYSTEDGHIYDYTISQSDVVSKYAPEDKYVTSQSGYDIVNILTNVEADAPEKGLSVNGSIYWEDAGDKLGFRPSTVKVSLYQNDVLYREIEIDTTENIYEFPKLPKYDENLEKYEYTVKETINAIYALSDGTIINAYDIIPDIPNDLDFTNVFHVVDTPVHPVKPEHINEITVKTNTNDKVAIALKGMEYTINPDLTVTYGKDYNGYEYNLEADNLGTIIRDIPCGKYEISINDIDYEMGNIVLTDNEHVTLIYEDGKHYLIIEDVPGDTSGVITMDLSKKERGYITSNSRNNYFSVHMQATDMAFSDYSIMKMSDVIVAAQDTYTITYMNSNTEDTDLYVSGEEITVLDYLGIIPDNKIFAGWSTVKESETAEYLPGDMVTVGSENIVLYPVFKGNSIVEEEAETDSSEQLEEPVIIETVD